VLLLSIIVLLIWVYLLLFHARFWQVLRFLLPVGRPTEQRRVAVIISARNEADVIGRSIGSLVNQEFAALFVVDDDSTDGTADAALAAARMAGFSDKLTVIRGSQLPAGWTGKVWAMHQGWQHAKMIDPDYILLTDADIDHAPDDLAHLIAQAERGSYELVSMMVKLHCETLAEKFLIPAFVYFFFLLYPPEWVSQTGRRVAGAAGGCMLLRPSALERAGGFESIHSEIIDDCALAARVKGCGGQIWLGMAQKTRSIRGYRTLTNLRQMIARTAFNQLHHSFLLLIACLAAMLLIFVVPLALVWSGRRTTGWIAVLACILMFTTYVPVLRLYRIKILSAVTLPFAALFYMYATLCSAVNYWLGKGGGWKGRVQDAVHEKSQAKMKKS
jgi:hopene-associated glycosyltransferase HpnB